MRAEHVVLVTSGLVQLVLQVGLLLSSLGIKLEHRRLQVENLWDICVVGGVGVQIDSTCGWPLAASAAALLWDA